MDHNDKILEAYEDLEKISVKQPDYGMRSHGPKSVKSLTLDQGTPEKETFDHTTIGLWTTEPKKRDPGKETLDQNSLDPRPRDPF